MSLSSVTLRAQELELVRLLGALSLDPPGQTAALYEAAGLPVPSPADYTATFVLQAPPHAAIHLSADGRLGGEALDRVEGFWRALGLSAPKQADHLGALLMSYAELSADRDAPDPGTAAREHAARTLLHEHIFSWAPGYLATVAHLNVTALTDWAELTSEVLSREFERHGEPAALPLALRSAPPTLTVDASTDEVLDALVAPLHCGVVLTQTHVAGIARELGAGFRRGERRFALRALFDQDKPGTLHSVARQAQQASVEHLDSYGQNFIGRWWSTRATDTAAALGQMADGAAS